MKKFDQLVELVIENYNVEYKLEPTKLYHASTINHLNSFIKNGINPSLAGTLHSGAGARQGKGFYLFSSRINAVKQAEWQRQPTSPEPIIVTISVDKIDPKNFDIDYEISGQQALKYLKKLINDKLINPKDLKLAITSRGEVKLFVGDFKTLFFGRNLGDPNLWKRLNASDAELLHQTYELLKLKYPKLFEKFEKENLLISNAVKYNGSEKIWPEVIETLDGKILWSNTKKA